MQFFPGLVSVSLNHHYVLPALFCAPLFFMYSHNYISAGKLAPATWEHALTTIANKLKSTKSSEISAIAGSLADAEVSFTRQIK
jgi:hypothetical protein